MIGENLKKIKGFKGLTNRELASKAGLSETTIWKIETGQSSPDTRTLQKLASAMEIEVALFFEDIHLSQKPGRKAANIGSPGQQRLPIPGKEAASA